MATLALLDTGGAEPDVVDLVRAQAYGAVLDAEARLGAPVDAMVAMSEVMILAGTAPDLYWSCAERGLLSGRW
jgi:hypothetical protein